MLSTLSTPPKPIPAGKPSAKYSKLQAAMIAATKARQAAMTAYAAAL
jgi:hypothetical protein